MTTRHHLALLAGAVLAGGLLAPGILTADADDRMAVLPDEIDWQKGPDTLPPGAEIAVLDGDPYAEGLYTLRVRLPADYVVPPHFHPRAEYVTVIEGTLYIGMGEAFDPDSGEALPAGSFMAIPGEHAHSAWTEDEAAVFQLHALGPYGITFVDPADDPRSQ